jgi:hypothetical protein
MRIRLCPLGRPLALSTSYQNACVQGVNAAEFARTVSIDICTRIRCELRGRPLHQQGVALGGRGNRDVRWHSSNDSKPPCTSSNTDRECSIGQGGRS